MDSSLDFSLMKATPLPKLVKTGWSTVDYQTPHQGAGLKRVTNFKGDREFLRMPR